MSTEVCDDGNDFNQDGCSSLCTFEAGWTCVNTYGPDLTTCTPVCGDGMMKPGEICDDGTPLNNEGCLPDCSGTHPGWTCSGGSIISPVQCYGQCGDGFIRGVEQCDDDNLIDDDGCSAFCTFETGWTCVNTLSLLGDTTTCTPICGDSKNVGLEICDDGIIGDNIGCASLCDGELPGWHCSGGDKNTP